MKDEIIRKQEELIAIKRISAGVYLKFNNELNLSLDDCENITEFIIQGYDHIFLKLAELKEQQPEQSAEEILDKVIELNNPKPFTKFQRYITLKAMQEYRQQGMPSDEEISRKLDALNFKTSKEREDAYDAIDYVINKWKGE